MDFELPDGTKLALADGATGADAAAAIGPGLARAALAVKVDGEVRDLARPLPDDGRPAKLEIVTEKSGDALDLIRHDTAHVLAAAVMELYPGVKISIGPPIEDGFYYDFDFPDGVTLTDADFERIEAKMREHIDADEPFVREDVSRRRARALPRRGPGLQGRADRGPRVANGVRTVSLYTNGPFTDLCRGPHAPSTKRIKAFKLQSVAGAYWRGDSSNPMLTRVYGTAFFSKGPGGAPGAARAGPRPRPPPARSPARAVRVLRGRRPASAFWLPAGTDVFNSLVALSREMGGRAATPRSRRRSSTTARCGRPPVTGTSTARTCS